MGNKAQNKGEGNGMSPEKIRELIDKGSGDADLNQIVFEELLDEQAQEFADAKPIEVDELTDDESAEMKEDEAEINQQLKRKARYDKARLSLRLGMNLKANDPESKLFKTAEELLLIVDKVETDPSSVSELELRKYKTSKTIYDALLDAEIRKRSKEKPNIEESKLDDVDIPGEFRTSPMSQTELATLYRGDMTQKKIKRMMEKGSLKHKTQSRQEFIFDKRNLQEHVQDKLLNLA